MRLQLLIFGVCSLQFVTATKEIGDMSMESRFEKRLTEVTRRLELLESRDQSQQVEIDSLKTELRVQKQRTVTLERLVRHLKGEGKQVKPVNDPQAEDNVIPVDDKFEVKQGRREITGNRIVQREKKAENEMTVAFYATLHDHQVLHAGAGQNIQFDHVITNLGNAYSPSLGAFVAPVAGTYVFSTTLTAYASQTEHYDISKNGIMVAQLYVRADTSPYMVASEMFILQLVKGDNIEIQTTDGDGSAHVLYSAFSGFLMQQDYGTATAIGK